MAKSPEPEVKYNDATNKLFWLFTIGGIALWIAGGYYLVNQLVLNQ